MRSTNIKTKKIRAKNNCWICEGWREVTFSYRPPKLKNISTQFVKLHLSFENWKFTDTMFVDKAFKAIRMCPPGEVLYFFTVNKKAVEDYGTHNFAMKQSIVYGFDDIYLSEFNENESKNNYVKNHQNVDSVPKIEIISESTVENNMDLNMSNMSFRSNVTQVMGEEMKEVIFFQL